MKPKIARRFLHKNKWRLGVRRIAKVKGSLEKTEGKAKKALRKK